MEAIGGIVISDVWKLIELKDWRKIKEVFSGLSVQDVAEFLENIGEADMFIIFRLLHRQQAAEVFSFLDLTRQMNLLQQMTTEHTKVLLSELSPDDRTEMFEELPGEVTQKLLNLLPSETRKEALRLLGYPEESVGRLMTPEYIAVGKDWTVKQAIGHIRQYGHYAETVDVVYVLGEKWGLVGFVTLRSLVFASSDQKIEAIMEKQFVSLSALDDQEEAVKLIEKYDLTVLPVVASDNVLLGIVTIDDVLDVLQDEVTEDIHKGASIVPLEMSYSAASIFTLYRKRVIWLSLLAFTGYFSTGIIAAYQGTLEKVVALAFFIPLLIGSGGNTGSQSATLIIRAISTGDISLKKWFAIIQKELFVGVLLGMTLGLIVYFISLFVLAGGDADVGAIVGVSMILIVLWANLVGSLLPIILTKMKLDPAVVSSPLVATLVDVIGLLLYFMTARIWLGI